MATGSNGFLVLGILKQTNKGYFVSFKPIVLNGNIHKYGLHINNHLEKYISVYSDISCYIFLEDHIGRFQPSN